MAAVRMACSMRTRMPATSGWWWIRKRPGGPRQCCWTGASFGRSTMRNAWVWPRRMLFDRAFASAFGFFLMLLACNSRFVIEDDVSIGLPLPGELRHRGALRCARVLGL